MDHIPLIVAKARQFATGTPEQQCRFTVVSLITALVIAAKESNIPFERILNELNFCWEGFDETERTACSDQRHSH